MDHRCPWIDNTVGFNNHKFFFLFLLYTNAACAILNISVLELLVHMTLPALTKFLLIGSAGLSSLLLSVLGPFFLFHCWLLGRNMTTVEFSDAWTNDEDEKARVWTMVSAYDLGAFENFRAVLGNNPLLWFLPIGRPNGDGLSFRRNPSVSSGAAIQEVAASDSDDDSEEEVTMRVRVAPIAIQQLSQSSTYPVEESATDDFLEQEIDDSPLAPAKDSAKQDMDESTHMPSQALERDSLDEDPEAEELVGVLAGAGDDAWQAASELTDDFRVGCEFVGTAAKEGIELLGEAARHSLVGAAGSLGDAFCRFTSLCSSSGHSKKKKRSSRVSRRSTVSLEGHAPGGADRLLPKSSSSTSDASVAMV